MTRPGLLAFTLLGAGLALLAGISAVLAQGTEADVLIAQAILAYDDRRYEEARAGSLQGGFVPRS